SGGAGLCDRGELIHTRRGQKNYRRTALAPSSSAASPICACGRPIWTAKPAIGGIQQCFGIEAGRCEPTQYFRQQFRRPSLLIGRRSATDAIEESSLFRGIALECCIAYENSGGDARCVQQVRAQRSISRREADRALWTRREARGLDGGDQRRLPAESERQD